jgi:hypothetical protein
LGLVNVDSSQTWLPKLLKHLGEAMVIAGILAAFVDPLLKTELAEQAQDRARRDVIEAAVGYPLPAEIQTRMRDWLSYSRVSRSQRLVYRFTHVDIINNRVRVEVEQEYEMQNLTFSPQEILTSRAFAEHERVQLISVSCVNAFGVTVFQHTAEPGGTLLKHDQTSTGQGRLFFASPTKVILPPSTPGGAPAAASYRFKVAWVIDGPASWGEQHASWTTPAIGIHIQVFGAVPPDLHVRLDGPEPDVKSVLGWEYKRAIMPFEVIAIRWFPKAFYTPASTTGDA